MSISSKSFSIKKLNPIVLKISWFINSTKNQSHGQTAHIIAPIFQKIMLKEMKLPTMTLDMCEESRREWESFEDSNTAWSLSFEGWAFNCVCKNYKNFFSLMTNRCQKIKILSNSRLHFRYILKSSIIIMKSEKVSFSFINYRYHMHHLILHRYHFRQFH